MKPLLNIENVKKQNKNTSIWNRHYAYFELFLPEERATES